MTPDASIPASPAHAAATQIIRTLRDAGHTAYLAGGCVRDTLLGLTPKDFDVATDAPPRRVLELFRGSRAVGESFGVVLVRTGRGQDAVHTEVATFRLEWGYSDGRRPDGVEFTDAEHDAQRRDFTMNGLFADPFAESNQGIKGSRDQGIDGASPPSDEGGSVHRKHVNNFGTVIDFVGGIEDIRDKVVRAIGDPDARFGEDYLRMLRAVRFAARLGFALEEKTAAAIRVTARYLGQISRERIGAETLAMLAHPRRADAAAMIQQLRLDAPTLNEDPANQPLPRLRALPDDAPHTVALAAWMLDRHAQGEGLAAAVHGIQLQGNRLLSRWRGALCLSNDDRDDLARLMRQLVRAAEWDALPVAQRKRLLASAGWDDAAALLRAIEPPAADRIAHDAGPLRSDGVGLSPAALVDGGDLIHLGLSPGPVFRELLDGVYDAQLEGRVADRDGALGWVRDRIAEGAGRG